MKSFTTCSICGEKVYCGEGGKFFCKKCKKIIKPRAISGFQGGEGRK